MIARQDGVAAVEDAAGVAACFALMKQ